MGGERGVLAPSTLHLFWDLLPLLADARTSVHVDACAYPIARWGLERLQPRRIPVVSFGHSDVDTLRRQLAAGADHGRCPLVLADGHCPGGGSTPLRHYLSLAGEFGGQLVVDDTQGLGVLGARPGPSAPLGSGGGGAARAHGIGGPRLVLGASLAKGLGVPVAVLTAASSIVERFERQSQTRVHCSQPSMATIRAAQRALTLNETAGDARRARVRKR